MGDLRTNTTPPPSTSMEDVPDDLIAQIFLSMPSSLQLVRAACTCKRWRRILASGSFRRRFRSLHLHPIVAGHYRVDEHKHGSRPPGCNPVFSLPRSAATVDMRPEHFSLDFLPGSAGRRSWSIADSRDGILLLTDCRYNEFVTTFGSLVVCDPMTRRCSALIGYPGYLAGWEFFGAFLLDGEANAADERISVSNFRVIITAYDEGAATTSTYSSADDNWWTATQGAYPVSWSGKFFLAGPTEDSIYWTTKDDSRGSEVLALDKHTQEFSASLFPEELPYWPAEPKLRVVRCDDGTVRIALMDEDRLRVFIQTEGGDDKWAVERSIQLRQSISAFRGVDERHRSIIVPDKVLSAVEGSVVLGTQQGGVGLVSVDLTTMEFKDVDDGIKYPAYRYQLPWPPTIRACLS